MRRGMVVVLTLAMSTPFLAATAEAHVPTPMMGWSRIVFTAVDTWGNHDVYSMRPDGTDVLRLTTDPAQDYAGPISPDGEWIVFQTERSGQWEAWLMRPDGSDQHRLTDFAAGSPTWSPDGGWLAVSDPAGDSIAIVGVDGTGYRVLTSEGSNWVPAWSPDGSRIAFASDRNGSWPGNYDIFVMSAEGTNVQRVTYTDASAMMVAWSPNGRRLLFDSAVESDGNWLADLWTIRPDGTDLRRLTNDALYESQARYAPVGGLIVFARSPERLDFFGYQLYTMNPVGSNISQLTTTDETSYHRDPYWGVVAAPWATA